MRKKQTKIYRDGLNLIGSPLLNKKITIYANANIENELGEITEKEVILKELFASIIPKTGSLLAGRAGNTILTKTTHKITVRYTDAIKENMIIKFKNHKYTTDYILNPYESDKYLEIFVQEVI